MTHADLELRSESDGLILRGHVWRPVPSAEQPRPKAVVHIAHGMAEHAGRYARFAGALNAAGYAVYGFDHRGHGRTAVMHGGTGALGHMADGDGWNRALTDLLQINRFAAAAEGGLPVLLFGHSMGSFMTQRYVELHAATIRGAVLCASNGKPPPISGLGKLIARAERLRLGRQGHSALIQKMGLGAFNKRFEPARTPFEWLSRDAAEVDAYMADPFCGHEMSTQFWVDFLDGLSEMAEPAEQAKVPKDLPLLIIAGTHDPVSAGTRGLHQLLQAYQAAGLSRVEHIFYEQARHELLNETNRDAVTADVIRFLDGCLA
ncbi:alpha/beta hydrolase [Ferrovibrio sp.]|uniref:alpha/beta hydrolase n=1 Tax=Ferrovibrio sp. TaxID=1917215 RepID=UPI003D0F5611